METNWLFIAIFIAIAFIAIMMASFEIAKLKKQRAQLSDIIRLGMDTNNEFEEVCRQYIIDSDLTISDLEDWSYCY